MNAVSSIIQLGGALILIGGGLASFMQQYLQPNALRCSGKDPFFIPTQELQNSGLAAILFLLLQLRNCEA